MLELANYITGANAGELERRLGGRAAAFFARRLGLGTVVASWLSKNWAGLRLLLYCRLAIWTVYLVTPIVNFARWLRRWGRFAIFVAGR